MKHVRIHEWAVLLAACGIVGVASVAKADSSPATTNTPPTSASGTVLGSKANESFFGRIDEAYREQLGTAAYTPPTPPPTNAPPTAPTRRGHDSPFDSPPWFNGEWQIGGTECIGSQNLTPDFPVMEALYQGPWGEAIAPSRIKFYGWVDTSGNISTSQKEGINPANGQSANYPLIYDQRPDRLELNQAVVYIERTPDEFQTDHMDWGFRISNVYGLDYRYMISRGFMSAQLNTFNNYYGFDMPMLYFNIYVPNVFEGLNITIGRIISEADIEAQLAPNNPMSTHSLLYSYDPYTQWGIFTTWKINDNWTFQVGLANGNDITVWQRHDAGNQPSGTVMFQYQSSNNKFSFYGGANCFNNAEWGYNNIQQYVGTFSYKWTDKIWTTHETWFMYQDGFPVTYSQPVNASYPETRPLGEGGHLIPGYNDEWATLDYTMFRIADSTFFTIRNELFDDCKGQRTGYQTEYYEGSLGFTWWPNKIMTIRPELRFDHAFEQRAYDNGLRHDQVVFSCDAIMYF
jgi:hypothetical protein